MKEATSTASIVNSVALCHQVRILDLSSLKQKIGVLNRTAVLAIQLGLAYLFDIT